MVISCRFRKYASVVLAFSIVVASVGYCWHREAWLTILLGVLWIAGLLLIGACGSAKHMRLLGVYFVIAGFLSCIWIGIVIPSSRPEPAVAVDAEQTVNTTYQLAAVGLWMVMVGTSLTLSCTLLHSVFRKAEF